MNQSKPFALFGVSLISLVLLSVVGWSTTNVKAQTCHLRELDLCATSLLVFTQSSGGLATNDQEINKQCVNLREANSCMQNYTRRCLTPLQREMATMASNSSIQMMNEYCTQNSSLRLHYLKHAQCLNQVHKKDHKTCMRDLQASLELLTAPGENGGKRFELACCTYRRFEACVSGQVDKKCGKDATSFVNGVSRRLTSRLPETMCRNYKPDSKECKALLPKPGGSPKGAKSNSIASRLLSAYTGL